MGVPFANKSGLHSQAWCHTVEAPAELSPSLQSNRACQTAAQHHEDQASLRDDRIFFSERSCSSWSTRRPTSSNFSASQSISIAPAGFPFTC